MYSLSRIAVETNQSMTLLDLIDEWSPRPAYGTINF